ncbi:probable LRR receptor-like serine/threonine-protein kinase At1g67720 isoform X2 [Cryptomeria japonica]|uniref:probable LRR receptor-like serine/threonine-protein kinase At1g67720 isoform X2 n=1 Tax=Cryptomeria japonica TaxID=3369 RepID=UPI0027DA977D|nr:probable LRR receptor-like serine/threonine-protein kinase At1g67720 isoform X2 [Cryptomeria japonica]
MKFSSENGSLSILCVTAIIIGIFVSVPAQPGFLNIDCGGIRNSIDSETNMTWIVDANYIDVGNTAKFSMPNTPFHMKSLRFFPKPLNKSCYRLPARPNVNYLLRLSFLFGNYKEFQTHPRFNYSVETEGFLTHRTRIITYAEDTQTTGEMILTSPNGVFHVCLIRSFDDTDPFISAIQLRSLVSGMYGLQVKPGIMLRILERIDVGNKSPKPIRYPQDEFDRFWYSDNDLRLGTSNLAISKRSVDFCSTKNNSRNFPPTVVLQTALIAETATQPLVFYLDAVEGQNLIVLYFAEIEVLNASEYRKFKIVINNIVVGNIRLDVKNNFVELPVTYNNTGVFIKVSIETIEDEPGKSSRRALINALEYYKIVPTELLTDAIDVSALFSIKTTFGMKNWTSDPCFCIAWEGITCNENHTVRVVELDLSGRNLSGSVPSRINDLIELRSISFQDNHLSGFLPDLCNLARLEILRLQDNNFSGIVPDCLSKLKDLKELNLENNNFSGVLPQALMCNRLLDLRYSGNPYLHKVENQCHSKENKIKVVVVPVIGALLGGSLVVIFVIMYRRRRWMKAKDVGLIEIMEPNTSSCRSFSLLEMKTATINFRQKIGEGGFGSVYFGRLPDGMDVAIKLLSSSSKQGLAEFLNEINLLSRVNHRNLVSLIGYCNDSKELMLVYEHLCGGSLKDHLYGSLSNISTLDWKTRLRVALDAAQGLEYLHVSCTPKIVHRDVKSSNILLDTNMRAKLADFGLSKIIGDDVISSHITTTVKGTVGYLDPEYFYTNKLTERSDVYSFGVVLLEMICGRKAINPELCEEEISLLKWVMLNVEGNDDYDGPLKGIIDHKLCMSDIDMKSLYPVFNLSLKCIQTEGSKRPTITDIVIRIKEAMDIIMSEYSTEVINEPLCSAECCYCSQSQFGHDITIQILYGRAFKHLKVL